MSDPAVFVQLVFWGGLLFGMVVGGALGAWKGLPVGGATAGLIIGVIGLAGSGYVMYSSWQHGHTVKDSPMVVGLVFGMFSTFALLTGLFFLAQIADASARAAAPVVATASAWARVRTGLLIVSNVTFVGAFGWMIFGPGEPLPNFGVTMRIIAVACAGYVTVGLITPGGPWTSVMIPLIVGTIFALFSVLIGVVG